MLKKIFFIVSSTAMLAAPAFAQNSNTGPAPRPTPTPRTPPVVIQPPAPSRRTPAARPAAGDAAQARAVREAFDSLVAGIRAADAEAVMALYWNSPQLVIFNNNGTVTRTWEQASSNRQSLYAKVADVKLDVRDVRVKTLGASGAVVSCLWEQTQTADGQPERATGRLTIVYQKVGAEWKIVHTHTSPDKPSPSNLLPSERTTPADATPPPARPPANP